MYRGKYGWVNKCVNIVVGSTYNQFAVKEHTNFSVLYDYEIHAILKFVMDHKNTI